MKKIVFMAFVLVLLLPVLATGCLGTKNKGDIAIGVAWPFASNNSMFREGVELAAKEINQGGGIKGRNIKLVMKDDEASVAAGMAVAQSFAGERQVAAVIGHRNSFVSIPASRIYEEAGLVMLSPASTAPELTSKGYRFVFRSLPSDDEIAKKMAAFCSQQGHKRMVIYYSEDSYGMGLANSFEDQAKEAGLKVVDRISYYGDLKDLERLRNKWQALDYDGIFIAAAMPAGAEFIADGGRVGISVPYYAGNAMDSPQLYEIGGKAAEGTVVGTIFNPDENREEVRKFVEAFTKEYNEPPGAYAAQGYDAVKLLAAAIGQAGDADAAALAASLRELKNWPGVSGYHSFDQYGNDVGDLVVIKVLRDGELQL
ncbi:ABC transporter substrate-binding protein [Pelotomaculum terephthalicicum JT]|uniref:ABC transporter substrate-binding protein n=1 Tax=Pelotomaculum terephthalicicum TaxID=206393 RepID=UPI001F041BF6|nr:ABC transporter substrate-binding protein [Pelotomaculum terephthalicicum]MCG9966578.1 ABC transporter substrate-binding protein [Pelotomaculum terephthalicicum JT]